MQVKLFSEHTRSAGLHNAVVDLSAHVFVSEYTRKRTMLNFLAEFSTDSGIPPPDRAEDRERWVRGRLADGRTVHTFTLDAVALDRIEDRETKRRPEPYYEKYRS